jgi:hypothetical protein
MVALTREVADEPRMEELVTEVSTVEELRAFIVREGSDVGEDCCLWADDFAHEVTD